MLPLETFGSYGLVLDVEVRDKRGPGSALQRDN